MSVGTNLDLRRPPMKLTQPQRYGDRGSEEASRETPGRTAALLSLLLAVAGCQVLIQANDGGSECAIDYDCRRSERCDAVRGRCVPLSDPDAADDAADVLPDVPDTLPDTLPDAADALPDAADAADLPPFGETGACGPGEGQLAALAPNGSHIPWAFCSPTVQAFTEWSADELHLHHRRSPDDDFVVGPSLGTATSYPEVALGPDALLLIRPNPARGETPNLFQLSLATDQGEFLYPAYERQHSPVQEGGRVALVSGTQVVVLVDGFGFSCGADGVVQSSPALALGRVLYLETSATETSLVVASSLCSNPLKLRLPQPPSEPPRLLTNDRYAFWVQTQASGARSAWMVDLDALATGVQPLAVPNPEAILELAARGPYLAVSRYRLEGAALTLYDTRETPWTLALTRTGRHPSLSNGSLSWAHQARNPLRWEVLYAPLP